MSKYKVEKRGRGCPEFHRNDGAAAENDVVIKLGKDIKLTQLLMVTVIS